MEHLNTYISKGEYLAKKYIFLGDNSKTISSVYVDRIDKDIICLSCMYGCPVGCTFCKSGESYYGNANSDEIIYMATTIANDNNFREEKRKVFSFMGSGEPLLNYNNVGIATNYFYMNFKNRSVSISLSGVSMKNFIKLNKMFVVTPKIQLSLHSPFDKERKLIIPNTDDISMITNILGGFSYLYDMNIEFNYVLLDKVNDSKEHAFELSELIKSGNGHFFLKINTYHEVNDKYRESQNKEKFIKWLNKYDVKPEIYSTDGIDIGAACGQLNSVKL